MFGQALAGTETRIDLTQFVPVDGQLIPYFWKKRDGDTEQFRTDRARSSRRRAYRQTMKNELAVGERSP